VLGSPDRRPPVAQFVVETGRSVIDLANSLEAPSSRWPLDRPPAEWPSVTIET